MIKILGGGGILDKSERFEHSNVYVESVFDRITCLHVVYNYKAYQLSLDYPYIYHRIANV